MAAGSLSDKVTPIEAGAPVAAVAFLGPTPALALEDGSVIFDPTGSRQRVIAHPDAALLLAVPLRDKFITGGDDGHVVAVAPDGAVQEIANEKGKWIDALAARADGAIAWSSGKTVKARDPAGEVKSFAAPSSVRGLAFLPKGYRLAIAHYNGASLWFPNVASSPDLFEWKGSHLMIAVSPDGRFIVTTMQENTLHGWRVSDKQDMRMSGYPAKTRSLSWSRNSQWLATSGADGAVIWPFKDKDGPIGKSPLECGIRNVKVTCVAFHPESQILAQGYEDGLVLLCRIKDGGELVVRKPQESGEEGGGAITALAWGEPGRRLLYGAGDGTAGLLTLPG